MAGTVAVKLLSCFPLAGSSPVATATAWPMIPRTRRHTFAGSGGPARSGCIPAVRAVRKEGGVIGEIFRDIIGVIETDLGIGQRAKLKQ